MAITFDLTSNAVVNDGQTASFEVSNIQGGTPPYTIEYYRNGVLDYTGNPLSFTADGSMDGDSIVARVSSDVTETTQLLPFSPFLGSGVVTAPTNTSLLLDETSPENSPSFQNSELRFSYSGNLISMSLRMSPQSPPVPTSDISMAIRIRNGDEQNVFSAHASGNNEVPEFLVVDGQTHSTSAIIIDPTDYYDVSFQLNVSTREYTATMSRNGVTVIDVSGTGLGYSLDSMYFRLETFNSDILYSDFVFYGLIDFTDSDPVIMSVLHYTSQPPSPQNLTEGDPFNATWDIAGVNPVGSTINYTVNKNGVPVDSGSTTDTTISYSIPSLALGDAGNYDLTITNGGRDPFQSDIVVVNVLSGIHDPFNTITKGAKSAKVYSLYGYSTEITLGMDRNVDSRGFVQWLDNGKEYDNYRTEYIVNTEEGSNLESILTDDTTDVATVSTPFYNGLYPFTPIFATGQDYAVYFDEGWKGLGDLDVNGFHRKYTLSIIPAVHDIYSSYAINGVVSHGCIVDNWQINGVPFPFSEWGQDLNNLSRVVVLGGNASEIVDTKREYGDVVKISLNCGEEQARQILYFITHVMRGTIQTATFPDVYNIFGRRYEGLTSCKVKLHSDILKVTHDNYHEVTIELELQMVGV